MKQTNNIQSDASMWIIGLWCCDFIPPTSSSMQNWK